MKNNIQQKIYMSDIITIQPSYLKGASRLFDWTTSLDNYTILNDQEALKRDWQTIGNDIQGSMNVFTSK